MGASTAREKEGVLHPIIGPNGPERNHQNENYLNLMKDGRDEKAERECLNRIHLRSTKEKKGVFHLRISYA